MSAGREPQTAVLKTPVSVLVVVHTPDLQVLLLERADAPGWWQSVTGSREAHETLAQTAVRELREETGLVAGNHALSDWRKQTRYEIYPRWRHRYAPDVMHNTEHVFSLCLPQPLEIQVSAREHLGYAWLPWQAAAERVFSPSNAQAIRELPARVAQAASAT